MADLGMEVEEDKRKGDEENYMGLPPELVTKIFNYIGLKDLKNIRLVSKPLQSIVDSHPRIQFKAALNDATAKCVQNFSRGFLDALIVEDFKNDIDILRVPPVKNLSITCSKNTPINFWDGLIHFGVQVQMLDNLEIFLTSIPIMTSLNSQSIIMSSVRTLTIELPFVPESDRLRNPENYVTSRAAAINFLQVLSFPSLQSLTLDLAFHSEENFRSHLLAFYLFLSRHHLITKLKLTQLVSSPQPNLHCVTPQEIVDSLRNLSLEDLDISFDYNCLTEIAPLLSSCNRLKYLTTRSLKLYKYGDYKRAFLQTEEHISALILRNCNSLESLTMTTARLSNLRDLNVRSCVLLKDFILNTVRTRVSFTCEVPPRFTIRTISNFTSNIRFDIIKPVLEAIKSGLEELSLEYYEAFDVLQLQEILTYPRLRKFVITEAYRLPPLIYRYCIATHGIRSSWTGNPNRNFCIEKNIDEFV